MTICELATRVVGPDGAPVVVFTGSLGTQMSMWEPQVRALSRRRRVVCCDVRGHGASPALPGPYTIAELGGDLVAVLHRLEIARATLVGLSIGGMMSMWAAAHAPERVERLVACCTTAKFDDEAAANYRQRATTVRESGLEPLADSVLARWLTPDFAADRPEVLAGLRADLEGIDPEAYAACCEALTALDLAPELAAIRAPTLVISAAEDQATPPRYGRAIAAGIAGARFELVDDAAHLATLERPAVVNRLLAEFLDLQGAVSEQELGDG